MSPKTSGLENSVIFRILLLLALACIVLVLVMMTRAKLAREDLRLKTDGVSPGTMIDREVDSVLARFRIAPSWSKRRVIDIGGTDFRRVERRVLFPDTIPPVKFNLAFSRMAERFGARAVGSENTKENTVTIHVELDGTVIQTIILKPTRVAPPVRQSSRTTRT